MRLIRQHSRDAHPYKVGALCADVARRFAADVDNRRVALAALGPHLEPGDFGGGKFAAALGRWSATVAFVREPATIGEWVQAPWRTAATLAGDCDDVAAAVCGFAANAGVPCAVAVEFTGPGHAHVFALVGSGFYAPWSWSRLTRVDQHGASSFDARTSQARLFPVLPPAQKRNRSALNDRKNWSHSQVRAPRDQPRRPDVVAGAFPIPSLLREPSQNGRPNRK